MSANGAFSTTLDYQFFGGGVVQNSGEVSLSFEPSLVSSAIVPIYAELDQTLDFTFSAGIETPTIYGIADLSFGFTVQTQADQGISRYAKSEWINRLEFEVSSEAYVIVKGQLNQTLDFNLDTNIYIFSDGESAGTFGFSVDARAYNISTRPYSRDGASYCSLNENSFNDVQILAQSNMLDIVDNGERLAEIITAFNK